MMLADINHNMFGALEGLDGSMHGEDEGTLLSLIGSPSFSHLGDYMASLNDACGSSQGVSGGGGR